MWSSFFISDGLNFCIEGAASLPYVPLPFDFECTECSSSASIYSVVFVICRWYTISMTEGLFAVLLGGIGNFSDVVDSVYFIQRRDGGGNIALVAGALDFGGTLFTVGTWEQKNLISRDGQTQLSTKLFFASFDQRSESAAGESACTALVAVIADWLHMHPTLVPGRAEFDMLIREGSAEWRNLCTVDAFKDRFPDKHFDLDTVIEAAVRSLSVVPEKSFVGFFVPDGVSESLDFLHDAMSFDSIWEEVERAGPAVYIVSWNDHFFVLKMEEDRCYIIDTLGERLQEGGEQAYILQFDAQTILVPAPTSKPEDSKIASQPEAAASDVLALASVEVGTAINLGPLASGDASSINGTPMELVSPTDEVQDGGKASCCQFIKEFFAALPLRELKSDIKKGLLGKVPLHQRLQIEFHFTVSRPRTEVVPVSGTSQNF